MYSNYSNLLQEWEEKAAEDKKRYEREHKEWLENGGAEAIKAQKKEQKAAKKAASGNFDKITVVLENGENLKAFLEALILQVLINICFFNFHVIFTCLNVR